VNDRIMGYAFRRLTRNESRYKISLLNDIGPLFIPINIKYY
jgi:hypothetical protein